MFAGVVLVGLLLGGCARDDAPAGVSTEEPVVVIAEDASGGGTVAVDGVIGAGEYAHETSIARMLIYWSNDESTLRMGILAPGTGYVAVGLDPVDRKVGANYILGWVTDDAAFVRDHVGTYGNLHEPDDAVGGTDDIIESAGTEIDRETTLEFIIPLDSGDVRDRPLAPGGTYVLYAAYHRSRDDDFSVHTGWGVGEISLDPAP